MGVHRFGRSALTTALLLALTIPCATAADDGSPDPFPRLEALEPNVEFWTRVFAEWSLRQVAVHDIDYPAIVYEVVNLPGDVEERYTDAQQEFIEDRLAYWKHYLSTLEKKVSHRRKLDEIDKRWALHFASEAGGTALKGAHKRVRSQRGLRERFREGLERSFRFDAVIRDIFRAEGLPEDLAFLPHVESSFQYHARSSAGATGLWQFTRGTGKRYLAITSAIDERLDPIAATRGAAAYLRDAYETFGTWPLALTSYNHGIQGMKRARDRFGTDFERIYRNYDGRLFGFASKNFYAEFLAARDVASRADDYFPEGYTPEPAFDLDHVFLSRRTTPGRVAQKYGVKVGELAKINPGWTGRSVRHGLALPSGTQVWLPRGTLERRARSGGTGSAAEPNGWIGDDDRYVVQKGDTLSGIAKAYGVSTARLRELNGMRRGSSLIRVGQKLRLWPETASHVHVVRRGETLSGIANRYRVGLRELREVNGMTPRDSMIRSGQKLRLPAGAVSRSDRKYVVQRGDTLGRIASAYGVRLSDLLRVNTLSMHSVIRPGQILHIP